MKRKTNLLLIILIVSSLGLILFPKSVIGSIRDIHYSFRNDTLFDSSITPPEYNWGNPPIAKLQNVRNSSSMGNVYYGSYSFENETGKTGTDISIIDGITGGTATVISGTTHSEIIAFDAEAGFNDFNYDITGATDGFIEFWVKVQDATEWNQFNFDGSGGGRIFTSIYDDQFQYYDGIVSFQVGTAFDNTWYNIYLEWYNDDTFDYFVNGVEIVSGSDNYDPLGAGNINRIEWRVDGLNMTLDAVGLFNEAYIIRDNMIPIITYDDSIKEVNRYEFALSDLDTQFPIGSDDFSTWTETEDGSDDINIAFNSVWNSDRLVNFDYDGVLFQDLKLHKDFTSHGQFLNITWSLNISKLEASGVFYTRVYSFDNTLITEISATNVFLRSLQPTITHNALIVEDEYYQFNLYINYNDNQAILMFHIDGVYEATYYFGLITAGKEGLGKVEFHLDGTQLFLLNLDLDYVGIYIQEVSICEWFGYLRTESIIPHPEVWYLSKHDLFTFTFNNATNCSFWLTAGFYFPFISTMTQITTLDVYDSVNRISVYDDAQDFQEVNVWCQFYDKIQANLDFRIDGSRLIEGSNEYIMEMEFSGIDLRESYFYVDDNNYFQFTLITDDTNTEYIQATFDIMDVSSTDKAISFKGYRSNLAFGYFVVDYLAGISTVDIPIIEKTTRAILPTNKTIENFIILISDNDQDLIIGTTTGYISHPILLNILGLGLPIITAGLIEMMIPLLLIIIPTLLISKGFGKEGKKLLIPLFLVFSLIATATLIIPVWIFFIIAFGNGLFLFRNKEIKSDI